MITAAVRSRLFELRRERIAARRSAELLDRKREALLREIIRRTSRRDELRALVARRYSDARGKLDIARVEIGMPAMESAALAQTPWHSVASGATSIMGIRVTTIRASPVQYRAQYGTGGTSASLDDAGAAFTSIVPDVLRLAEQEAALARLRLAARKTTKLLNSLEKFVIPRIDSDIRAVSEGIEEEERDEAARRVAWSEAIAERSGPEPRR